MKLTVITAVLGLCLLYTSAGPVEKNAAISENEMQELQQLLGVIDEIDVDQLSGPQLARVKRTFGSLFGGNDDANDQPDDEEEQSAFKRILKKLLEFLKKIIRGIMSRNNDNQGSRGRTFGGGNGNQNQDGESGGKANLLAKFLDALSGLGGNSNGGNSDGGIFGALLNAGGNAGSDQSGGGLFGSLGGTGRSTASRRGRGLFGGNNNDADDIFDDADDDDGKGGGANPTTIIAAVVSVLKVIGAAVTGIAGFTAGRGGNNADVI